ncbi:hypothetical protein HY024_00005 [Candidatus Curtissbacteria bacterium]|nr:hypothetical protein [Candidatus Curtissbacteria bacterium]
MDSPSEFRQHQPSELLSPDELARAVRGVADFKLAFAASNLRQRKLLRYGENAQHLQNTFLGLKPASQISSSLDECKRLPLPDRFKFQGMYLYDSDLAAEKIAQNPDVFSDYKDGENLDESLKACFEANPAASRDLNEIKKIGLLFGFPKDAVISYADNIDFFRDTLADFHEWARAVLYSDTGFSDLEKEIILHIAHVDRKGHARLEEGYLHNFLDKHGEQTRAFLSDYYSQMTRITEGQVNFIVQNRHASAHGIQYGTGVPTKETLDFPRKVEEAYSFSGMNSVLRATRLLKAPR